MFEARKSSNQIKTETFGVQIESHQHNSHDSSSMGHKPFFSSMSSSTLTDQQEILNHKK